MSTVASDENKANDIIQPTPVINIKMEHTSSPLLQAQAQAQTSMPVYQPKGRGRPRASYAQTGEFDLGLIREYQARPALYDRSNKLFKDKILVAQLWMQMSHKLGYDVSILRERMITLRNRYNIEKRRLENISLSTSTYVASQWPLFDTLSFLSDHIRTRRSYKTQSKSIDGRHDEDEDESAFDVDDMNSDSNGHVKSIKHEQHDDYEDMDNYDGDQELPVTTVLNIPHRNELTSQQNYNTHMNGSDLVNGKGLHHNNLGNHFPSAKRHSEQVLKRGAHVLEDESPPKGRRRESTTPTAATYPKFRAFGEFVSHSLTELPHSVAMRLVETFTRELVHATTSDEQSKQQQEKTNQNSINNVDD